MCFDPEGDPFLSLLIATMPPGGAGKKIRKNLNLASVRLMPRTSCGAWGCIVGTAPKNKMHCSVLRNLQGVMRLLAHAASDQLERPPTALWVQGGVWGKEGGE